MPCVEFFLRADIQQDELVSTVQAFFCLLRR